MANTYSPQSLGIKAPAGGFQQGGWYNGRQYWGGTLSDPNVIHPSSNQSGAGQAVSQAVVAQSAAAQGKTTEDLNKYFEQQTQAAKSVVPTTTAAPTAPSPAGMPTTGGAGATGGTGSISMPQAPTIDLPGLYKGLYESSGISKLEEDLTIKSKALNDALAKNGDNPYLSEATMSGRSKKLRDSYNNDITTLQNQIATKKADVETQLQLQTKQFDINSQAATQALSQFNTLLTTGALTGASGEDIANITRATGISSSMIQSAIDAAKAKNVQTQVVTSTDDKGNVTISVIDQNSGKVIKTSSLGAVGQTKTVTATQTKEQDAQANEQNAVSDIQRGATLQDLVAHYAVSGGLTVDDLYRMYNIHSPYGAAQESIDEVKTGKFVTQAGYNQ